MDLNIFNNLDNNLNKDEEGPKFIEELKKLIEQETIKAEPEIAENQKLEENENRKEGHLYLVTEDRNGEAYLWDYTEKSEIEMLGLFVIGLIV